MASSSFLSWLTGSSSSSSAQTIDIPPVPVHDVETAAEKRPRTLKHLLRANHANHAIIYHGLEFNNHMPHLLCSAYLLGGDAAHLYAAYEREARELEPWTDSPEEVSRDDWRGFLGEKTYQRAFVDFFEDALALRHHYDWKKVVGEFLFGEGGGGNDGDDGDAPPLAHCLISALGHPLIHLGYAYEMDNKEVAMEALGLVAAQYNHLHKYLDDPAYTRRPAPGAFRSGSPRAVLERLAGDARLDGAFARADFYNFDAVFERHEAVLLEYWNAWTLVDGDDGGNGGTDDPVSRFRESQALAVALLVETVARGTHAYNFFLVHLLTTSHAVRILLPVVPLRFRVALVRQWWLLVLAVYIAECRPRLDPDNVPADVRGRTWSFVENKALTSEWKFDSHYLKAIRAMREAARTWGDVHDRYLRAALRFVDEFEGWTFV